MHKPFTHRTYMYIASSVPHTCTIYIDYSHAHIPFIYTLKAHLRFTHSTSVYHPHTLYMHIYYSDIPYRSLL